MKKYISIVLAVVFISGLIVAGFNFFSNPNTAQAGLSSTARDVLGSRTGTTTTAAGFYGSPATNGTTTSIIRTGGHTDTANLTFKIASASSTPDGRLYWATFGSNDSNCQTATTTTSLASTVVMKDINWFATGNEGSVTATGAVATGTVQTISNLTWECLKVETNGSSTEAWAQIRTKDNSVSEL